MLVVVLYLASLDLMYFKCFVFSFFFTSCHVVLYQSVFYMLYKQFQLDDQNIFV